ncbi:hypothetical protein BaRGS_00010575 [Batillaria attramentaria]|uniref:Uncharacterized protein n=1 Tax=Batillaria attramentaria TaxID=370345 RepID=A0ABD0LFY3_9CAEN
MHKADSLLTHRYRNLKELPALSSLARGLVDFLGAGSRWLSDTESARGLVMDGREVGLMGGVDAVVRAGADGVGSGGKTSSINYSGRATSNFFLLRAFAVLLVCYTISVRFLSL